MTTAVNVAPDGRYVQTNHSEIRINNEAGASRGGQATIPFVASMQTVTILEAYTRKANGRKLKADPAAIREQLAPGLPQLPMFTDQRVKVIVFPQVAAGDTVVYTARITTKQPYFPNQFMFGDVFLRNMSIGQVAETITAPKTMALNVENHGVAFSKRVEGANTVYSWHYTGPKTLSSDIPQVSPLDSMPRFFASSWKSFSEVGRAYAALAAPKEAVTPRMAALANEITKGVRDRRVLAQRLYEWVNKHIRYVALELGKGSFIPHAADDVVSNGFGDCKDHAVVLHALLKAKGIDSQSVLINSGTAYTLTGVPTFMQLNHVITWIPEFKIYVDSTAPFAPFGLLPFQEYGKPVVVADRKNPSVGKLPVLPFGSANVTTRTVARLDGKGQLTGKTTTTGTGPYALLLHLIGFGVQAIGPETAAERQLAATGYSGGSGTFTSSADDSGERYTVSGTFKVPGWAENASSGFYLPGGLRVVGLSGDALMGPFDAGRLKDTDPTVCFSGHAAEDLSLQLPASMPFPQVPKDTSIKTANLTFTAHWILRNHALSVHRDFVSKVDQPLCTGEVRKQTAKALKQIVDSYNVWLTWEKGAGNAGSGADAVSAGAIEAYNSGLAAAKRQDYKTAAREFSQALAHDVLPPEQAYVVHMSRATVYYRERQALPAIQDLTAAIRLKPDDIRAYGARASLYQELQQEAFALADYAKMRELAPTDPRVRMAHGDLSMQLGRYADAIQDYNVVLRVYSSNTAALTSRGLAYRSTGDFDRAAEDLKRAIALGATDEILPSYLCDALSRSRNPAAAVTACNDVLRQNRFSAISLEALGYAQYRLRHYREALQEFQAAAGIYPNKAEYLFAEGVAKIRNGDTSGGRRDVAEAEQLSPTVVATMAKMNLKP